MRIGIEAQRIFRKRKGGMDVAAQEIIRHLQKVDKENEYIIYSRKDEGRGIEETDNFKIKYIKGISYADWEQIWLPLQAQKDKLDILHCTSNTAPIWGAVPKIVTVHDIIYLEKKDWPANVNWYQRLGNYYRSLVVPMVVNKASQVLTVSEFEKENLLRYFQLHPVKINVVGNGVNKIFQRIHDQNVLDEVRNKYHLPEKFILFMGNTEPRKNMRNLFKAYSILVARNKSVPSLLVTGITLEYLRKILSEIGEEQLISQIALTGYADFKDLPALYNLSDFFVYPSLREGFGLPILEAMACGTAVITSNVSSMPEVAGDAALLANPENPESIADAMIAYISDERLKRTKIEAGILRCKLYGWEESAKKLKQIYRSFKIKDTVSASAATYAIR